jgi:hypothetical protein
MAILNSRTTSKRNWGKRFSPAKMQSLRRAMFHVSLLCFYMYVLKMNCFQRGATPPFKCAKVNRLTALKKFWTSCKDDRKDLKHLNSHLLIVHHHGTEQSKVIKEMMQTLLC